jgi:DNA-binding transcriptional regulator YdaS (Cro superfamily)
MVQQQINRKLKAAIMTHFDSQGAFARSIGMQPADLSRLIRCRMIPTQRQQVIISRVLNVSARELFPSEAER